eukprot:1157939-Pelagomonas_calceolata.AAC.5
MLACWSMSGQARPSHVWKLLRKRGKGRTRHLEVCMVAGTSCVFLPKSIKWNAAIAVWGGLCWCTQGLLVARAE